MAATAPLRERLLAKAVISDAGCWEWTAYLNSSGYGVVRGPRGENRTMLAHRATYEIVVGPIPDGLDLDHLCKNRKCINPAHLEPVTSRVNTLRSAAPAALNAQKTHCMRDHEFTPENTQTFMFRGRLARKCKTCKRARESKQRAS